MTTNHEENNNSSTFKYLDILVLPISSLLSLLLMWFTLNPYEGLYSKVLDGIIDEIINGDALFGYISIGAFLAINILVLIIMLVIVPIKVRDAFRFLFSK